MDLDSLTVLFLVIGATIGAYRGGWRGCLLGLVLGLFAMLGWIVIAWLTREGSALNPAPPLPDEITATGAASEPAGAEGIRIWKLERELRGARNAVIVLLIWTALIFPIWMWMSLGSLERRRWLDVHSLTIRDHDYNLMGSVSAPGPERCRLVDAEGNVYWASLELTAENAGTAKLLLSSTEAGQPRLDLLNQAGDSVWHAP